MNKMIKTNEVRSSTNQNLFIKLSEIVGSKSVGRCGIWFNQP